MNLHWKRAFDQLLPSLGQGIGVVLYVTLLGFLGALIGAPGADMMKQVIEKNKEYLKSDAIEEYQQSLEDRLPQ